MRSRNIKPGYFKNEELAALPYEARLLFAGLWCLADREGRLEDRPQRIRAEVFPYDVNLDVDALLTLLTAHFIKRYAVDERCYIQIINFVKHASPHHKEESSTIPPPSRKRHASGKHDSSMRQARVKQIASSPLIPDSLIPDSRFSDSSLSIIGAKAPEFDFESVWAGYPRKLGKHAAQRHFKAQVKTPEDYEKIQRALNNFKSEIKKNETEERFIPHGSTWFNNKWRDYAEVEHGTNGSKGTVSYFDKFRRAREAEAIRDVPLLGEISTSGGDLPDVSSETGRGRRHGDAAARDDLEDVRKEDCMEKKPNGVEIP